MKKKFFTREIKLGLIVIGSIFLLYFGLNFLKGINIFSSVHNYYAKYENIGGLVASSPVYIKGYKVGQVDAITYNFSKEEAFVIKVSVKKDIALPIGTKLDLYDDGLMGGKAIQILLPEQYDSNKIYANADTIQSHVSVGLIDQLASGLLPKIEDISSQADSLLQSLRLVVEDKNIINTLASVGKISADLAVTSDQLKRMVSNDVPKILDKVDIMATDFVDIGKNLKSVDYASMFSSLDHTISNINSITDKINNPNGTLGSLINNNSLYISLLNATTSADSLLIDLQENPKRYVHFSLFGRK